jgi:hypothetical protein
VDETSTFDVVVGSFDADAAVPVGLHAALLHAPAGVTMTVVINPELAYGATGLASLGTWLHRQFANRS